MNREQGLANQAAVDQKSRRTQANRWRGEWGRKWLAHFLNCEWARDRYLSHKACSPSPMKLKARAVDILSATSMSPTILIYFGFNCRRFRDVGNEKPLSPLRWQLKRTSALLPSTQLNPKSRIYFRLWILLSAFLVRCQREARFVIEKYTAWDCVTRHSGETFV